jgi:hypothetical protein
MKNSKSTLTDLVKSEIKVLNHRIAEMKSRLDADFEYNLAWVGEDLYKANLRLKVMNGLIAELGSHTEEEVIAYNLKYALDFITRSYNVRENSTGSLHREVSTWKFQVQVDFYNWLKDLTN